MRSKSSPKTSSGWSQSPRTPRPEWSFPSTKSPSSKARSSAPTSTNPAAPGITSSPSARRISTNQRCSHSDADFFTFILQPGSNVGLKFLRKHYRFVTQLCSSVHINDFDFCEHYNKLINGELSIRFGYFHRMPILTHPAIGSIQRGIKKLSYNALLPPERPPLTALSPSHCTNASGRSE